MSNFGITHKPINKIKKELAVAEATKLAVQAREAEEVRITEEMRILKEQQAAEDKRIYEEQLVARDRRIADELKINEEMRGIAYEMRRFLEELKPSLAEVRRIAELIKTPDIKHLIDLEEASRARCPVANARPLDKMHLAIKRLVDPETTPLLVWE